MREWAASWGISPAALIDLRARLGAGDAPPLQSGTSEAAVQSQVRLEGSRKGIHLFRNNVGAMYDEAGNFVRFGLANDSAAMNKVVKSGDLIGIRPVLITERHLGSVIGQFVSREIKAGGWRYAGTEREQAQLAWAQLIIANGGDASFASGEGTL
jgi:hypothetical protein